MMRNRLSLAAALLLIGIAGASAQELSGSATDLTTGTIASARLPNPTSLAIGGVMSKAVVSHQFLTGIGTDGSVTQAQPACSDLSNAAGTCSSNALSALATQAANTVVANVTSSTAAPTAASLPSCADSGGNHLNYTSGTGWSCGTSSASGITLISTQTASTSASLQFTNLPASYNTLFLNCAGLVAATNAVDLDLEVGEGATPTWETTGSYVMESATIDQGGGGDGGPGTIYYVNSTSASTMPLTYWGNISNGSGATVSSTVWISNVGSASLFKTMQFQSAWQGGATTNQKTAYGSGHWDADKNAITAIRVKMSAGNISSGTCSLYGMN